MARKKLDWSDSGVKVLTKHVEPDGSVNFYAVDQDCDQVIHLYRRQPVEFDVLDNVDGSP